MLGKKGFDLGFFSKKANKQDEDSYLELQHVEDMRWELQHGKVSDLTRGLRLKVEGEGELVTMGRRKIKKKLWTRTNLSLLERIAFLFSAYGPNFPSKECFSLFFFLLKNNNKFCFFFPATIETVIVVFSSTQFITLSFSMNENQETAMSCTYFVLMYFVLKVNFF